MTVSTIPVPATGLDPLDPDFQRDPYPTYRWLLRHDPVHRGAGGTWYVTSYEHVRTVMSDERFGCASVRDFWEEMIGEGALKEVMRDTLFFEDDPKHKFLRSLISPMFAPKRTRVLQPRIEATVADLLSPLARRGRMELVSEFAAPLALTFVCELLGVPRSGHDSVRRWSIDIAPTLDLVPTRAEIDRGNVAMGEFTEYLDGLVAQRRAEPRDDLISIMIETADDPTADTAGFVTRNAIVSSIISVVFAGHDTVTNQVSNTVLALLQHPEQLELLRRDPDLIPNAVEESLRYDSAVQSNSRRLDVDVELGDRRLPKGDFVVALMGAANRDPEHVPGDPNVFDITRKPVSPMSFGVGMRFCLGAMLARIELRAALDSLVQLPDLQLDIAPENLRYQRSSMFRSLVELPVTHRPVP